MTSMYGLKVVNSDTEFEHYLRKFGFDTETGAGYGKGTLDLDKWPKEVWDMVGGEQSPEDAKENPNLRPFIFIIFAANNEPIAVPTIIKAVGSVAK